MLTGDSIGAEEAHHLDMVSKIFSSSDLAQQRLAFARRIAAMPTMTSLLVKESVNQTMGNMGFYNSLQACFTIHQLNHANWSEVRGDGVGRARPEDGIPDWRTAEPVVPALRNTVRAMPEI
jgi:enoyl-CoA hydratase